MAGEEKVEPLRISSDRAYATVLAGLGWEVQKKGGLYRIYPDDDVSSFPLPWRSDLRHLLHDVWEHGGPPSPTPQRFPVEKGWWQQVRESHYVVDAMDDRIAAVWETEDEEVYGVVTSLSERPTLYCSIDSAMLCCEFHTRFRDGLYRWAKENPSSPGAAALRHNWSVSRRRMHLRTSPNVQACLTYPESSVWQVTNGEDTFEYKGSPLDVMVWVDAQGWIEEAQQKEDST